MVQMIRILQYLECPQYLRKYLFPIQKDLQFAGLSLTVLNHKKWPVVKSEIYNDRPFYTIHRRLYNFVEPLRPTEPQPMGSQLTGR